MSLKAYKSNKGTVFFVDPAHIFQGAVEFNYDRKSQETTMYSIPFFVLRIDDLKEISFEKEFETWSD